MSQRFGTVAALDGVSRGDRDQHLRTAVDGHSYFTATIAEGRAGGTRLIRRAPIAYTPRWPQRL